MKQISISNYEDSTLNIYNIPDNIVQSEEYEKWITEILGYKLSNIEWFIFKEIVEHDNQFNGHCPECNSDNLDNVSGGVYSTEMKCDDCGHDFGIEANGWRFN